MRVFEFENYKDYIVQRVGSKEQRRGIKSKMAKAIACQPTYVSQVLNGDAHFSLEQAMEINGFLGHSAEESEYFLTLVQLNRSGTRQLQKYFGEKLAILRSKRMVLTERLGKQHQVSESDQARYYSSWHYAAFHIALTIPSLQSHEALAEFFKVPLKMVSTVTEFLITTGLVSQKSDGRLVVGTSFVRLGNDSHNILRHHSNWRQVAIEALDREDIYDLHYSAVMSLTQKTALKIKDKILETLKEDLKEVSSSKEEELYAYCIDFFNLRR